MTQMREMQLSPRLMAIAEQVPKGSCFADVGTDHARLPVWLITHGVISGAIATDLREGPLSRARRTAQAAGVLEQISFRLGDGLSPLRAGEVSIVAIAGMGGDTIAAILSAAAWARGEEYRFLLQPMSSTPELRQWLWQNGFAIEAERLVGEGEVIYPVLSVRFGGGRALTPAEEWAGTQWRGMEAPLRSTYLARLCVQVHRAVSGMQQSPQLRQPEKLGQWQQLAAELEEMKKEWEQWQL